MATEHLRLPHDSRVALAAMGAILVIAALVMFVIFALMRNVGAY
jgi:hypothetical protein